MMTIKRLVTAIALASLMGIVLPVATAQAPPCFTFDGQIKTMQCPVSFRPSPVQYYSNAQTGFSQATDNEDLPSGFFDQQVIDTLRQNAAQNQSQSQNATQQQAQQQRDKQILALLEQQPEPADTNATAARANQIPPATNLTISDIEPVRNGLNAARQALEQNNTQAAIGSINRADGALFAIIIEEGKGPVSDGLTILSDDIETTRASLRNLDNEKALEDLNAADAQLLVITDMLPIEPEQQNQSAEVPFIQELPANQTEIIPPTPEPEVTAILPEEEQSPANETETEAQPEPQPAPTPAIQAPAEQPTITTKIPLNKTQQEIITIEEGAGLNKTTAEKTTITIVEGNKTTHREITTTEVPL